MYITFECQDEIPIKTYINCAPESLEKAKTCLILLLIYVYIYIYIYIYLSINFILAKT